MDDFIILRDEAHINESIAQRVAKTVMDARCTGLHMSATFGGQTVRGSDLAARTTVELLKGRWDSQRPYEHPMDIIEKSLVDGKKTFLFMFPTRAMMDGMCDELEKIYKNALIVNILGKGGRTKKQQ
jgi:hypothetical protein